MFGKSKRSWAYSAKIERMTSATSAKEAFKTGCTMLAVSGGIAAAGYWTMAAEQAQYPGEKDFGVGILAVLFGIPVVILLGTGLGVLLFGVILAHKRQREKQSR
jgi:hypothetical protein